MRPGLWPAVVLGALGLAQMAGDLAGVLPLKALAAATCAAPAPKVFSAVRGFETYSTRFFLEWPTRSGDARSAPITAERAARLRGPYNRRNVYGAALAYGPVLPPALRAPVMAFALCGPAPLVAELGIAAPDRAGPFRVRFAPRPGSTIPPELPLVIEAPCF